MKTVLLSLLFIISTKANEFAVDTDGHRIIFLHTSTDLCLIYAQIYVCCVYTYKEFILYIKKEGGKVKILFILAEEQYQLVTHEENSVQILFT